MVSSIKQRVPPSGARQARRKEVVGGSVTRAEKAEIEHALEAAGYHTTSEGVRDVMLHWTRGLLVKKEAA